MVETVLAHVPVGTPVDNAQRFMEREGFQCYRYKNSDIIDSDDDRIGVDHIRCRRYEEGFVVSVDWFVDLIHRDGKVVEVLAKKSLTGP